MNSSKNSRTKKIIAGTVLAATFLPVLAHEAHVHGIAKLDVAVENKKVSLNLDTPLANLVGFEHVPKKEKDRLAMRKAETTLQNAKSLFVMPAAAGCEPVSTKIKSDILEKMNTKHTHAEDKHAHKHDSAHADLEAAYEFTCVHPEQLNMIDVQLFKAFKGFRQIDVQLISPKGQSAQKLTPQETKIQW